MRMAIGLSVLITLLGCASPKPAPPPSAASATTTETAQQRAQRLIDYSVETGEPINTADRQKLFCRQESVANTRLKNRKICLTEEQWAARNDSAKDAWRDAVRSSELLPPEDKK